MACFCDQCGESSSIMRSSTNVVLAQASARSSQWAAPPRPSGAEEATHGNDSSASAHGSIQRNRLTEGAAPPCVAGPAAMAITSSTSAGIAGQRGILDGAGPDASDDASGAWDGGAG